jgi:hypothetical protein
VDWVTPFSLLYLYKHIGVTNEEKPVVKYNNNNNNLHDITVGTERIKLLLE